MPVRVWGWLEAFSFLQMVPSHGTIGFGSASWTSPDQTGAGFGLGGSSLARGCLFWKRKDYRCQFGFWGGSRPSVFFTQRQQKALEGLGKGPETLEGPLKVGLELRGAPWRP